MSIAWAGFPTGIDYVTSEGVYDPQTNSQTGTLIVKSPAVNQDKTYTCTVSSLVNKESTSKSMEVQLNVYGK